jgi:hypothetical protein
MQLGTLARDRLQGSGLVMWEHGDYIHVHGGARHPVQHRDHETAEAMELDALTEGAVQVTEE